MSDISTSLGMSQGFSGIATIVNPPIPIRTWPETPAVLQFLQDGSFSITPATDLWLTAPYILTPTLLGQVLTRPQLLATGRISGDTTLGSTLSYQPAFWACDTDGPAPSTAWQWYSDGAPIAGATAADYIITISEQGTQITVTETCTQAGYVAATCVSDPLAIPIGALPTQADPSAPAISGATIVGSVITLLPGLSSGADQHQYRWVLDGVPQSGEIATTYLTTAEGTLLCEQRARQNGVTEWSGWVASNALAIVDIAPVLNTPVADISRLENDPVHHIDLKPLFSNDTSGSWNASGIEVSVDTDGIMALDFSTLRTDSLVNYGYTNASGSATGSFNVTVSAYPLPVATGVLSDQLYVIGSGDQTVDASLDFTNAIGGAWSVNGAGATIDTSGLVTIPTDVGLTSVVISVTYANASGSDTSAFSVNIEDPISVQTNAAGTFTITVGGAGGFTITPTPANWGQPSHTVTQAELDGLTTAPLYLHEGILSGATGVGDTLTYQPGFVIADGDGPAPITTWEWQSDGVAFTPSSGANGLTHDITAAQQGTVVSVLETTSQTGTGSTNQVSNAITVPSAAATNLIDTERASDFESNASSTYVDLDPGSQFTQSAGGALVVGWNTSSLATGTSYQLLGTLVLSGTAEAGNNQRIRLNNPSAPAGGPGRPINENIKDDLAVSSTYPINITFTTTEVGVHQLRFEIDQTNAENAAQTISLTNVTLEET